MAEPAPTGMSLEKYIPLPPSPPHRESPYPLFTIPYDGFPEQVTPEIARKLYRKHIQDIVTPFETRAVEPNPQLANGIDLARNSINDLRKKLGLPPVPPEDMKILILNPEDYNQLDIALTGGQQTGSLGFSIPGLDSVIIKDTDTLPDYIQASNIYHELTHRWLEREAFVFSSDNKGSGQYRNRILITPRRAGVTTRVKERGQDVHVGAMLNELGSFYIQKLFIDNLEGQGMFTEELRTREQQLTRYINKPGFTENGDTISFAVSIEGQRYDIRLDKANLHFNKQNDARLQKSSYAVDAQIASDLIKLCGTVDFNGRELSVGDLLIEAKVNPMVVNTLQAAIDRHMGKGFYRRLSDTDNNSLNPYKLLSEIQSKLYSAIP